MLEKYKGFCKEYGCETYKALSRLKSILDPSESTMKDIEMIKKVKCEENCELTADQFCEWLKRKKEWLNN